MKREWEALSTGASLTGLSMVETLVLKADGRLGGSIELHDSAAKKGRDRTIPHADLRRALQELRHQIGTAGAVIGAERAVRAVCDRATS